MSGVIKKPRAGNPVEKTSSSGDVGRSWLLSYPACNMWLHCKSLEFRPRMLVEVFFFDFVHYAHAALWAITLFVESRVIRDHARGDEK